MTILVTGANGFVGHHLVDHLTSLGHHILATGHHSMAMNNDRVEFHPVDLMDRESISSLPLAEVDSIVHLAGLAAVGPSFENPQLYLDTNVGMQNNLYQACITAGVTPKVLVVSSGSLYDPKEVMPITETSGVLPSSPYAESKLAQELSAGKYAEHGFEYVIARPFNHAGPGQREGFIVADLAKQIAEAEHTGSTTINVGNLDAKRDYTDVRDIARAYALLLEDGKSGETYNICSGRSLSGHEILDGLLASSTNSLTPVQDPAKMRPVDVPDIYGDFSKIAKDCVWKPEIDFEQTLKDTLEYWRAR